MSFTNSGKVSSLQASMLFENSSTCIRNFSFVTKWYCSLLKLLTSFWWFNIASFFTWMTNAIDITNTQIYIIAIGIWSDSTANSRIHIIAIGIWSDSTRKLSWWMHLMDIYLLTCHDVSRLLKILRITSSCFTALRHLFKRLWGSHVFFFNNFWKAICLASNSVLSLSNAPIADAISRLYSVQASCLV